jgi:hypothetical protein
MTDHIESAGGRPWGRRWFLRAATMAAAMLLPHASRAEKAPIGAVADLRGEAFREVRSERRLLAPAAPLFVHDLVGTGAGSRVTLHLGKDTVVHLGENARLTIDRFLVDAGGEITLQSGPILYDHREGAGPDRMQIRSAFGQIAVRGTRFFAGPSAGVFGVFVERGSVAVTAGGARVVLEAGQGTNIVQPGADPTPPVLWKPPRIQAALDSVQ